MNYIKGNNIRFAYKDLINRLMHDGEDVGNTLELTNCIVQVYDPTTSELYFPYRKISEDYAKAELNWYWKGQNQMEVIAKHAKLWRSLSDDGVTNNSAYGYICELKYGYDQIQKVIEILSKDPTSRRALINISDPCLDKATTKDLQCTVALQFLVRNHALEMTVYMRSNDVYFGFPYDYIYFVSIGEYISSKLDIPFKLYTHHATSMHMYKKDIEKFIDHCQITRLDIESIIKESYDETYSKRN